MASADFNRITPFAVSIFGSDALWREDAPPPPPRSSRFLRFRPVF